MTPKIFLLFWFFLFLSCGFAAVDESPQHKQPEDQFEVEHDQDKDGIIDFFDNCPYIYNPSQFDTDNNGWGDDCFPVIGTNFISAEGDPENLPSGELPRFSDSITSWWYKVTDSSERQSAYIQDNHLIINSQDLPVKAVRPLKFSGYQCFEGYFRLKSSSPIQSESPLPLSLFNINIQVDGESFLRVDSLNQGQLENLQSLGCFDLDHTQYGEIRISVVENSQLSLESLVVTQVPTDQLLGQEETFSTSFTAAEGYSEVTLSHREYRGWKVIESTANGQAQIANGLLSLGSSGESQTVQKTIRLNDFKCIEIKAMGALSGGQGELFVAEPVRNIILSTFPLTQTPNLKPLEDIFCGYGDLGLGFKVTAGELAIDSILLRWLNPFEDTISTHFSYKETDSSNFLSSLLKGTSPEWKLEKEDGSLVSESDGSASLENHQITITALNGSILLKRPVTPAGCYQVHFRMKKGAGQAEILLIDETGQPLDRFAIPEDFWFRNYPLSGCFDKDQSMELRIVTTNGTSIIDQIALEPIAPVYLKNFPAGLPPLTVSDPDSIYEADRRLNLHSLEDPVTASFSIPGLASGCYRLETRLISSGERGFLSLISQSDNLERIRIDIPPAAEVQKLTGAGCFQERKNFTKTWDASLILSSELGTLSVDSLILIPLPPG